MFWLCQANSTVHCNSEQYIVKEKGKPDRCQNCGDCHPGYGREPTCGTVLLHPPQTTCEPCKRGTFSDAEDSSPCKTCHLCAPHELVTKKCTNTSNTICNNECTKGYYFENASHDCKACSYCCGDGKDKIIKECTKQGMPKNRQCTIHRAQQCNPPTSDRTPTGQPAAPTSNAKPPVGTIVGCIVGGIVGIALFFIWCLMYRKRKSRRQSAANIGVFLFYFLLCGLMVNFIKNGLYVRMWSQSIAKNELFLIYCSSTIDPLNINYVICGKTLKSVSFVLSEFSQIANIEPKLYLHIGTNGWTT